MPLWTVSGILTRIGMGRLGRTGLEPAQRYERSRPGELVHIDIKKLGRIAGAGHRVTGDRASQNTRYSRRARGELGWEYVHVAVDDHSRLAYAVARPACRELKIRHHRIRSRRPQTNGGAERFIRTMLAGWAYAAIYGTSRERAQALDGWLWHYNHRCRRSALGHHGQQNQPARVLHLASSITR